MKKRFITIILTACMLVCLAACGTEGTVQKAVDEGLLEAFGQTDQTECKQILGLTGEDWQELDSGMGGYRKEYNWCGSMLETELGFLEGRPIGAVARRYFTDRAEANEAAKSSIAALIAQLGAPDSIGRAQGDSGSTVFYSDRDEADALQWLWEQTEGEANIRLTFRLWDYVQEGEDGARYFLEFLVARSGDSDGQVFFNFDLYNANNMPWRK